MPSEVPAVRNARSGVNGKPRDVYSAATASRPEAMPGDGP